jgi:hypothetical protein
MQHARVLTRDHRPLRRKQIVQRKCGGAAMVEALIVLPVLSTLLFAVPLLHERYAAKQQALLLARRAAWAHVLSGCVSETSAEAVDLEHASAPDGGAATDVVDQARRAARGRGDPDVFDELPLLADALGALLGELVRARAEFPLRPRAGVQQRVGADFVLLCNERPRDVFALAKRVFCERLPIIRCGGGS